MDERRRAEAKKLRELDSAAAADYLIETFPVGSPQWGEAIILISHRSWAVADQRRLADHYLSRLPYAHAKAYEVFAAMMSFKNFVQVIRKYWPGDEERVRLLEYHLGPVVRGYLERGADPALADELWGKSP